MYGAFIILIIFTLLVTSFSKAPNIGKIGLDEHNKFRAKHGSPPLKIDSSLNSDAQKYANHLASIKKTQHSKDRKNAGENLARYCSKNMNLESAVKKAVNNWYAEIKDYKYDPPGGLKTGHFTQVVWKDSKLLGIGATARKDKKYGTCIHVVGRYWPPGNYKNRFKENVLKPK